MALPTNGLGIVLPNSGSWETLSVRAQQPSVIVSKGECCVVATKNLVLFGGGSVVIVVTGDS